MCVVSEDQVDEMRRILTICGETMHDEGIESGGDSETEVDLGDIQDDDSTDDDEADSEFTGFSTGRFNFDAASKPASNMDLDISPECFNEKWEDIDHEQESRILEAIAEEDEGISVEEAPMKEKDTPRLDYNEMKLTVAKLVSEILETVKETSVLMDSDTRENILERVEMTRGEWVKCVGHE